MTRRIIGIVGSEQAKFTQESEAECRFQIYNLLLDGGWLSTAIVSGGCHLGGVDQYAAEIGREFGLEVIEHVPRVRSWTKGYAPRNMAIARDCTECHCFTVDRLPAAYTGMRFDLCYHCGTNAHVKSGGCWTVKQARKMGKPGFIHVINTSPN